MYEIYGYPYGNPDAELLIYQPGNVRGTVFSPKLTREVSKGGSLTFTMPREHPQYEMLQKMSTVVQVRQDGKETWRGRIFSHEADWYNNRAVYCEGALSFFNDSCVTPFNYEGTLKRFLQHLIDVHNAQVAQKMKMFELGTVTAALGNVVVHFGDADKYGVGEDYGKIWDILDKMVRKVFGGYFYCTFNADTGYNVLNYCDQAVEEKRMSAQKIEYGVNLLNLTEKTDTNNLYTRIYPVGNKHTVKKTAWYYKLMWWKDHSHDYDEDHEERWGIMETDTATIKKYLPAGYTYNLTEGYIEHTEAVKKFGVIARIVEFDTDSANDTFAAGVQALQQNHTMVTSYVINAVDLVDAGEATDRLTFACYAHILSAPHSVDAVMLCSKLVEPLDHPEKKEFTFGMTRRTLTDRHVEYLGKTNLLDESSSAAEKYAQNLLDQLFAYKRETNAKLGDISNNLTSAIKRMGDLQDQIDDNITSWFYEGKPTTTNEPASSWTTETVKRQHIGDLYYDKKTGLGYRWVIDTETGVYSWTLIRDTGVAKALADAAAAQSTADSKVRCFISTPTPPYDRGDIWMQGDGGDIMRCQTLRYVGEKYNASDWVKASKYTDDTLAKTVEGNLAEAAKKIAGLQTQMDGKVETWYYSAEPTTSNAPASSWKDDATRKLHIGDLYYNLSNGRCYHWTQNGSSWRWELVRDADIQEALTAAARAQAAADGKIRCFTATPVPPYDVGDLWVQGTSGDIMRCNTARASGGYNAGDWVKASKYTDDTLAKTVEGNLAEAVKKIAGLQTQMDGKVETWYYSAEPTTSNAPASSWKDDATRKLHIGDLYYNLSNGRCYHWTQNGSSWRWELVRDADIQEALTAAARAQAAADGKIRCFTATPVPPYDVGDLWVQGTSGDIMRCSTARASGGYNAGDWVKASKYTDDTLANEAKNDAAEAAKTATNFLEFNQTDGLIVRHESLPGKRVQITNDGVKVLNGSSMVNIKSDSISITDGNGSCSITSGNIIFHGLRQNELWSNGDPAGGMGSGSAILTNGELNGYSAVAIGFGEYYTGLDGSGVNGSDLQFFIFPVNGIWSIASRVWDITRIRTVRVSSYGIEFGQGGYYTTKAIGVGVKFNKYDTCCVPCKVYGFM